jgi:cysteine desulfurase
MKPDFEFREVEIYLDNAATTLIDPEVVEVMRPYLEERFGNPETVYRLGREANTAVKDSRAVISDIIKCKPEELFFTSGGTESNNWAIKGVLEPRGVIVSSVEHASVLEPANWVSRDLPLFKVPVDEYGIVDLEALKSALKNGNYGLVSIQYANNEIGTLQPVREIADLCQDYGVLFHCDAVQAFGKIDFDVEDIGADMISFSAHKLHGPMGIGALYVKGGTEVGPLLHGGGQEYGMRSGTLAVPEIVGFAKAAEVAIAAIPEQMPRLMRITEWLAGQICCSFRGAKRNGHPTQRLPNIVSVTLPGMETEVICGIMCTKFHMCLSAGAACSTEKRASHVLEALGRNPNEALSTLRFSLSKFNTDREMKVVFGRLQAAHKEALARSLF